MNEEKFDELFKSNQLLEADEQLEKRIRRGMNRRIYAKSFKIMLCTVLCFGLGTWGFSKLLDVCNYDPKSENDFVMSADRTFEDVAGFNVLTSTYLNMYYPGITCQGINDFSELGFGSYEITLAISNPFRPMIAGVGENHILKITRSKIEWDTKDQWLLTRQVYEYLNPDKEEESREQVLRYGNPADEYEELLKLPDSAVIDVSLSFPETKNANELMAFIEKCPDASFLWVALDTTETQGIGVATGFSLYDSWTDKLTDEAKKQYPSFYLTKYELTADTLVENYLSKLRLLADHPRFARMMDESLLQKVIDYEAKYQSVLENGIEVIGVRAYFNKADLLHLIDTQEISHMTIHEIKLSKYS